jgi:Protein of unknown function (DUF3987)
VGERLFRLADPAARATVREFGDMIAGLLSKRPEKRRTLPLSAGVLEPWRRFHDDCETKMLPGGELHSIKGLGAKLAEHALRIAGIMEIIANVNALEIGPAALQGGVALCQHYAAEAKRLAEEARVTPGILLAEEAARWIFEKHRGEPFIPSDLFRRGPYKLRNSEDARPALALLVEHGWLEKLVGVMVEGKARRVAYRLTPDALAALAAGREGHR